MAGLTWPIPIEAPRFAAAGTVLWRHVGRLNLTIVVKAKFNLNEGLATLAKVEELVTTERFAPQSRSLSHDLDIAPYKPRAEVTFVGHACSAAPVSHLSVRLGVHGEGTYFEKPLQVFGDRVSPNAPPAPFQKLPLLWERTWGDQTLNPVGVGQGSGRWPNIFTPVNTNAPAGYGPIARTWGARQRFVGRGDAHRLEGTHPEMPNDLSWGFFLCAPGDQQLERLRGNEMIMLENLIEGRPKVRSKLPGPVASARVFGPASGAGGTAVDLKMDTLSIDGDRHCVYLVWRGTTPFPYEATIAQTRVVVSVEVPEMREPALGMPGQAMPAQHVQQRPGQRDAPPATQRVPPPPPSPSAEAPRQPKFERTMPVGTAVIDVPKLHQDGASFEVDEPESSVGSTMAIDPEAAMRMLANARAAMPFEEKGFPAPRGGPPPAPPPPAPPEPIREPPRTEPPLALHARAEVVVRPAAIYAMTDEDSVGSTMAVTPEAAAQLLARAAAGPPMPPAMPAPLASPPGLISAPPPSRSPGKTAPPNLAPPAPPPPLPPAIVMPAAPRPPQAPTPPAPPPQPRKRAEGRHGTMEMEVERPPAKAPAALAPRITEPDEDEGGGGTQVLEVPEEVRKRGFPNR